MSITATSFDTPAGHGAASAGRLRWGPALALHLGPAAATFAGALLLAPWLARLGLPRDVALTAAFALLLTPIEFGLLLRAAHRATGRWSPRAIAAVLAFRRPLGRRALWVPPLLVVAVVVVVGYEPLGEALARAMGGIYPDWLLPGGAATGGTPTGLLVGILLCTLAVDGIANPLVEELYFRGWLLPRLPVTGWTGPVVSAALFAAQHYWQPWNWLMIFGLQVLLTVLVVRLRCLRLGIVMHALTNSAGILATLVAVLAG